MGWAKLKLHKNTDVEVTPIYRRVVLRVLCIVLSRIFVFSFIGYHSNHAAWSENRSQNPQLHFTTAHTTPTHQKRGNNHLHRGHPGNPESICAQIEMRCLPWIVEDRGILLARLARVHRFDFLEMLHGFYTTGYTI